MNFKNTVSFTFFSGFSKNLPPLQKSMREGPRSRVLNAAWVVFLTILSMSSFFLYADEEEIVDDERSEEGIEEKIEIKNITILREGIDFSNPPWGGWTKEIQESADYAVSGFLTGKEKNKTKHVNIPLIKVELETTYELPKDQLFLKLYYYNDLGLLVGEQENPWISAQSTPSENRWDVEIISALLKPKEKKYLYFGYDPMIVGPNFRVLALFGTKGKMAAKAYPVGEPMNYDFDEKAFLETPELELMEQSLASPNFSKFLIEKVIETKSEIHPRMTLFLLLPPGIKSLKEIKGVMFASMPAGSVSWVRASFLDAYQGKSNRKLYNGMLAQKYAILGWATRRTWIVGANFDTISPEDRDKTAKDFQTVAEGWKKGVLDLCQKYGLGNKNFFVTGYSAGSAWCHRIALLYPELFIGAHIHVCGGFEMPTDRAQNIHWVITTGSKDGGLENSIKFYNKARSLEFPIVMKSEINLAHEISEKCEDFAVASFKFVIEQKHRLEGENPNGDLSQTLWESILKIYKNPPYYGNWETNEFVPANEVDKIPEEKRMPLLNEDIKEAWMGLKKQY